MNDEQLREMLSDGLYPPRRDLQFNATLATFSMSSFLGEFINVYHIDVLWAPRLVADLLRCSCRFQGCPAWRLRVGTPCAALNSWLLRCKWALLRPWVWEHLASVKYLFVCLSPQLVDGWINRCRHNLRVGWRAFQFKEWSASTCHELVEIPLSVFRKID